MTLFTAKTTEGSHLKVLAELLKNVHQDICIVLNTEGISISITDSNQKIFLNIKLIAENFDIYEFSESEKLVIGVDSSNFYRMLKSIKKKSNVLLKIESRDSNKLTVVIGSSSVDLYTYFHQESLFLLEDGYDKPIVISPSNYYNDMKEICSINKTITVRMRKYSVLIEGATSNVYRKRVLFGEQEDLTDTVYFKEFESAQFKRLIKVGNLGDKMRMYSGSDTLPLKIRVNVGMLGFLELCIKSKDQL